MKLSIKKIRQSEFMAEHGILPIDIRDIRDKHLDPGDWWKEGATIYWSQEAADRVKAALFPHSEEPTTQTDEQDQEGYTGIQEPVETPLPLPEVPVGENPPEDIESVVSDSEHVELAEAETQAPVTSDILTVRVLKRARNYRYVYASLDGERIAVQCPKKGRKNIVGKNVSVSREIIDDGTPKYTLIP